MRKGEANAAWILVKVSGPTPGKRYGHTMSYMKPHLVVFGGHGGIELLSDIWILCIEKLPLTWEKIDVKTETPPARVYHTANIFTTGQAAGMLLIFGGRAGDQSSMNDAWGLRRQKNNVWEWIKVPYKRPKLPCVRFQVTEIWDKYSI